MQLVLILNYLACNTLLASRFGIYDNQLSFISVPSCDTLDFVTGKLLNIVKELDDKR